MEIARYKWSEATANDSKQLGNKEEEADNDNAAQSKEQQYKGTEKEANRKEGNETIGKQSHAKGKDRKTNNKQSKKEPMQEYTKA